MATVKIFLGKDETPETAKEDLLKAIIASSPEENHEEAFHDPAAEDLLKKMEALHKKTLSDILDEVNRIVR